MAEHFIIRDNVILARYDAGESIRDIAQDYGASVRGIDTVRYCLRRNGVNERSPKGNFSLVTYSGEIIPAS